MEGLGFMFGMTEKLLVLAVTCLSGEQHFCMILFVCIFLFSVSQITTQKRNRFLKTFF